MIIDTQLFARRLAQWTLLCGVCAARRFWAGRQFDWLGMTYGVAAFILAYSLVTSTAAFARFDADPFVHRTLRIGFGTRVVASLLFPVGMIVDLGPGMASIDLVRTLGFRPESCGGTFLVTIAQGTLLNILLALYMLLVYVLVRLFHNPKPPDPNLCTTCGYDIRASRQFGRCPECGAAC